MTYVQQTWTDNVTPVDKAHMDHIEAGIVALDTGKLTIPYGTSLPASPVDGQVAILVDSITNPTYQWMFRYNAGSTSAYKWEFIGGAPKVITNTAAGGTTSGSFVYIAGAPLFTLPRVGEYEIGVTAGLYNDTANMGSQAGISIPGVGVPIELSISWGVFPTSNQGGVFSAEAAYTCATAGDVAFYQARIGASGTAYANGRTMRVLPRRV